MYDIQFNSTPLAGNLIIGQRVHESIALALDPAISALDPQLTVEREGEPFYTGAGMLRMILGATGQDHLDPATVATVRRLAADVLGERAREASTAATSERSRRTNGKPQTWQERIAYVVRLDIACGATGWQAPRPRDHSQ